MVRDPPPTIPNDRTGSKIWQAFARPRTQETLNWLRVEVIRCHAWMLTDGVACSVDATTFFTGPGGIGATVTIVAHGQPRRLRHPTSRAEQSVSPHDRRHADLAPTPAAGWRAT